MMTLKSAASALPRPLRAGIRQALTFSRVPDSGFVARQISIHQEYQSRHACQVTISNQFQAVLDKLDAIAQADHLSHRKLAVRIGIPERTLRRLRHNQADRATWLPKLESAAARLQAN